MQEKLVSIIIPTYNRERFIGRAIDSCIKQSYKNIEIIVCDDHSTDDTQQYIAKRIKEDKRIRYCETPNGKKGSNVARNTAIQLAKGRYLAFLDSDDYLTDDSIKCRVEIFEKHPNVGMVYGNVLCEVGKRKIKWIFTDMAKEGLDQRRYLMQELSLCITSGIMVRQEVNDKVVLFNEAQKAWQDDWLCVGIGMKYAVLHSEKFVAVIRDSEGRITSNKWGCYFGCKILVKYYKKQIIHFASHGRYLLWKIRLFSLYCQAKEIENKADSKKRKLWETLHVLTRKLIWPFFRFHFE